MAEQTEVLPSQTLTRYRPPKQIVRFAWQGAFEGWSRRWVSNNFWRVRALFVTEDDAVQECALIFVRCKNSYEGKVDNPAWFMSLFKRAVVNDWHTFAQRDGRLRELPVPDAEEGIDHNPGFLLAALASSSGELQQVLKVIAKAPAEFIGQMFAQIEELHSGDPKAIAKKHRSINQRVKRLCGITGSATDVLSELRAILTE